MIEDEAPSARGALDLGEAADALESLREPAERTAQAIDDAFAQAGSSLARSLARAAADGEVSLAELARAVLRTLNGLFGARGGGVDGLLAGLIGGVAGGLARMFGAASPAPDPASASSAGGAMAGPAPPVVVNVSLTGPAEGLLRSEAQLAQTLARAVALGARRL